MLQVSNLSLRFGKRILFENVNLKFNDDNCYGLIGANGAGKTTFLKLLSGEIDSTTGDIVTGKDERISVLKQNHNAYDEQSVINTVIMGNTKLYNIMMEKDALYQKPDFNDEDGIKAGELESIFADMNGWQAETDAAILLSGLGIDTDLHYELMSNLTAPQKIKVLLASALFGEPDILLLDEPTNNLDIDAKVWLEEFLINFNNTVIVVSHDRHFLNKVCTHMVDIDFERITMFVGNYDFWYQSSQLLLKQMKDSNKKKEDKIEELKSFIARFSANASKSKQATSRKKLLEKITLDEIKASTRKYPYINFNSDKRLGKEVVTLKSVNLKIDGVDVFKNLNLIINPEDKVAFIGNKFHITTLFKLLSGEIKPDSGEIIWGTTTSMSYFPKEHENYFKSDNNLIDFLRPYSTDQDESYLRGFLGRMLFSGEETLKKVNVLSGGEKVRCMLSKVMLDNANVIILDEPTNHLDIESITSLNNGMTEYNGCLMFASYDHELLQSVANRIIEFKDTGKYTSKLCTYDEYLRLD